MIAVQHAGPAMAPANTAGPYAKPMAMPMPAPAPQYAPQPMPTATGHHSSQQPVMQSAPHATVQYVSAPAASSSQQQHQQQQQQQQAAAAAAYAQQQAILAAQAALPPQQKSNSTSSMHVTSTIVEPNMGELVSSVSTMLHCQMMRDADADEKRKQMLPYFCEERYTGKIVKDIPQVKYIYQFLKQVFEVGQFNPECCVISLVYINRLIGVTGVPLTQSNWKPISISALVLAQKVWDDTPLINADFSILYPALTVKEINFLERKFLDLLEFKLTVSASLYAQYYFELRSICEENQATGPASSGLGLLANVLRPQPLSKLQAKRLEQRSQMLSEQYARERVAYRKKSMTVEDIVVKHALKIIS